MERIADTHKGLPAWASGLTPAEFVARRPGLLDGGFLFPLLTADAAAVTGNIEAFASYAASRGALLCPHGKTTMSRELVQRQLAAGAWGITAATISQVRAFRAFGVRRVLLANELVDPAGLDWLLAETARDPGFSAFFYVDTPEGVALAAAAAAARRGAPPLQVLLEVGVEGRRTGARTPAVIAEVAAAVRDAPGVRLAGVAGYEGVIGHDAGEATVQRVRTYLAELAATARGLLASGALDPGTGPALVTAGGSLFYDVVIDELAGVAADGGLDLVLRSGCYVTHDHGMYAHGGAGARQAGVALLPALRLWARVLSRPEPELALVGFGRRDCSFDAGLPVPLHRLTADGPQPVAGARVVELNDQHAFVQGAGELRVGELVAFGISHPCTTLDKWPVVPMLDETLSVTDCFTTTF